jgi:hypothetical protein
MELIGIIGVCLITYGPVLAVFMTYLRRHPQLFILLLFGAFAGVVALSSSSILYQFPLRQFPMMRVMISSLLQMGIRAVLFVIVRTLEQKLEKRRMKLYVSYFKRAPVSFVIGLGFGLAVSVIQFGTSVAFEFTTPYSTWYDLNRCAKIPLLLYQGIISLLFVSFNVCCTMIVFAACSQFTEGMDPDASCAVRVWICTVPMTLIWGIHVAAAMVASLSPCYVSFPVLPVLLLLSVLWTLCVTYYPLSSPRPCLLVNAVSQDALSPVQHVQICPSAAFFRLGNSNSLASE